MAEIHPINLNPAQLVVPKGDYSWLGDLANTYQQSKANQFKIGEAERRQGALAELGKLNPNDPNFAQQAAAIAFRMGDLSAGFSALNNAAELKLKREELEAKRSAPTLGGALPTSTTPAAPTPQAAPAAPSLVAPGVPALPFTPNVLPSMARPPGVSASLASQTTQTPPIMAQATAPGSNFSGFTTASGRPKVSYAGVSGDLMQSLNAVGNKLGRPLEITSARDSQHTQGSQHYVGQAVDIRNRNMTPAQQAAVVAELRSNGLNVLVEGDHIHASLPRGGQIAGPGTVTASLQGRGPISTGQGGGAIAAASPGVLSTPMARTQVAALDPSFTPPTGTMTDAGPQPIPGVSPAAPAAQGAAGQNILPPPTPLQAPVLSLAALGMSPPGGGVGTIGPMGGTASDALPVLQPPPQGVQMAQARPPAAAPYSPPFPMMPAPQGAPALPARPPAQAPVQQAPAQPPAVARGPVSGSPLENIPNERLLAVASHRYSSDGDRQLAIDELKRRAAVAADANKTSTDYNDYLADVRSGAFKGTRLEYEQAKKADVTLKRLYDGVIADRASRGMGPPEGGFEKFVKDMKGGVTVNTGTPPVDKREEAFIDNMKAIKKAGDESFVSKTLITNMRKLDVKTGLEATIKYALGEIGIPTQGLDQIQAFQSLLDFMVPSQPRAPGSQSEFEAKTIRSSLPRLITQPGGKELIMNILESVADLNAKREAVAGKYLSNTPNDDGTPYTAAQTQRDMQALRTEGIELAKEAAKLARSETPGGSSKVDAEDRALVDKWRTKK